MAAKTHRRPKTVQCQEGSETFDIAVDVACEHIFIQIRLELWDCFLSIINDTRAWQDFLRVYPMEKIVMSNIMEKGKFQRTLEHLMWTQKLDEDQLLIATIREKIQLWAPSYLAELYLGTVDVLEDNLNDFQFAMRMATQRDIHNYCPMCIEDVVGLPEDRDRLAPQETIMFRPCGHTVCLHPCLAMLQDEAGLETLTAETILATKSNLPYPTIRKISDTMKRMEIITTSLTTRGGFDCPMCRVAVKHTFMPWDPSFHVSKTVNKFARSIAREMFPRLFQ